MGALTVLGFLVGFAAAGRPALVVLPVILRVVFNAARAIGLRSFNSAAEADSYIVYALLETSQAFAAPRRRRPVLPERIMAVIRTRFNLLLCEEAILLHTNLASMRLPVLSMRQKTPGLFQRHVI
jgi:hypothetical protein